MCLINPVSGACWTGWHPEKFPRVLHQFHEGIHGGKWIYTDVSEPFPVSSGTKQDYGLGLILFTLLYEVVMKKMAMQVDPRFWKMHYRNSDWHCRGSCTSCFQLSLCCGRRIQGLLLSPALNTLSLLLCAQQHLSSLPRCWSAAFQSHRTLWGYVSAGTWQNVYVY